MRSMRREGMDAPQRSNSLAGEHLHRVAFDDVVPAFEGDAALESFADLVDVIFEAAQGSNCAFPHLLAAARQTDTVTAMDDAVGDDATGDDLATGFDRLADFGVAVDDFLVTRLEHAAKH